MQPKVSGKEKIIEAALKLIAKRGGVDITMAQIAQAARMSRQAVYLHFADRGDLMIALARHTDQKRGLDAEIQHIRDAPSGLEAMRRMVSLQARSNPSIWPIARMFEAVRRSDQEVERPWQDRLQHRLTGCQQIMRRVEQEGDLLPGMSVEVAADLMWTLTSLRMWEDLVLLRGWSPRKYEQHVFGVLLRAVTNQRGDAAASPR
jgi:AcrR family transcriptional regulator